MNFQNNAFQTCDEIAKSNLLLLLDKGVCIARGFVKLQNGCAPVLLTNFCNERRHLMKDTAIPFVTDVKHLNTLVTVPLDPLTEDVTVPVKTNQLLSAAQKDSSMSPVRSFSDGFATLSKVRRTPATKYRIVTDESARPVHQQPYLCQSTSAKQ